MIGGRVVDEDIIGSLPQSYAPLDVYLHKTYVGSQPSIIYL